MKIENCFIKFCGEIETKPAQNLFRILTLPARQNILYVKGFIFPCMYLLLFACLIFIRCYEDLPSALQLLTVSFIFSYIKQFVSAQLPSSVSIFK